MTDKKDLLIKNIPFSQPVDLAQLVEYKEGSVISRTLSAKPHVNITLFAFDAGEEISAHTSPGDAMVQVLDEARDVEAAGAPVATGRDAVAQVIGQQQLDTCLTSLEYPLVLRRYHHVGRDDGGT